MPPTIPINHYYMPKTNKMTTQSFSIIPCWTIQGQSLPLNTLILLTVKYLIPTTTTQCHGSYQMDATTAQKPESPSRDSRASTTSFLTATTLIYAIGAGITAAAGTRLALQLILKSFKLSHSNHETKAPRCYFLSLPP
jgi:hypothetical protein